MKIIESKSISNYEAKKYLESMKDDEISFEQKVTKDFLNKYYNFDKKTYEEVKKELLAMELKDHQIAMILNILPIEENQVKAIFAKERNSPTDEQIKKIIELCIKLKS